MNSARETTPLRLAVPAAGAGTSPRTDEEAARTFAETQIAHAELRVALLHLAQTHLESEGWKVARRVLTPLPENAQPTLAALEAGDWKAARRDFAEVLRVHLAYREAAALEREAYLPPARQVLEASCYKEARA